jgi:4-hydroxybenzoate polyprenyltransferase
MIAVLFATQNEATPFIEKIKAQHIDTDLPVQALFKTSNQDLVVVTGMGRNKAAKATHAVLNAFNLKHVVNAGLCGALSESLHPGDVYTVGTVQDGDANAAPLTPLPWQGLPSKRLATVAKPVYGGERRETLATHADMVDMEGLEIAQACATHGVRCTMIKGVSDHACENAAADIMTHIHTVSQHIADILVDGLPALQTKAGVFSRLHHFTRVEHTLFSLPLIFAGAWIGAEHTFFGWRTTALIVLVGSGGRMMGMALNRLFDRNLDALNPRTANRELPSGRLSVLTGYAIAATGLLMYLAGCAALGKLCLYLAPVPLIPLILYSLLKRFTRLCHFGIGICLAMGPMGAYVAAAGTLPLEPEILLLATFTFFWISGFDIIYALQDMESDKQTGVNSIPAALGPTASEIIAAFTHVGACAALVTLWVIQGHGILPGVALLISLATFIISYAPAIPLAARFFPISAIAGISAALVPLLEGGTR